jgi:hypothetical protein
MRTCGLIGMGMCLWSAAVPAAETVLVEAESFVSHGGWQLDTQFIQQMGSPYLLAHGLGKPVADATTRIRFPRAGTYRVFVRTMDWVARWQAPGQPGRFQVLINGQPLAETFGTTGAQWLWQPGGEVAVESTEAEIALRDLTGFDGRCDAVVFTTDDVAPPNETAVLSSWRRELLGLAAEPTLREGYDLVVVGGGYSGMGASLAAARAGCRVALIQDRPVLGGNGSSEVRVWSQGLIRRGKYPRIGEIVEEFADKATKSPGTFEEFEDAKKEALVRAESKIDLYLNHHAYAVEVEPMTAESDGSPGPSAGAGPDAGRYSRRIKSVSVFDTRTSEHARIVGRLYADCTGHGTIGFLAGADWDMTEKGRMGMSNMWAWAEGTEKVSFPETPWALDLTMDDFPYPRDHHGQWFWEGGFDKDPLDEAEAIRDWNLRAVFGAFNAMKNRDGAADHSTAHLTWVAFIGGPRESRRLMGDVLLTQEDIVNKQDFPDGCVPSTWSIDLHYPKEQYAAKYPDNPFISIAEHDRRIDRNYGYPVPYRCFYSRNVENLFMAGRCISVTHEALGTTRVMKTCGMMGEVVGKAASVCVTRDCWPRDVYQRYWDELDALLRLPGKAFRPSVHSEFTIPDDALPNAGPYGPMPGLDPQGLPGIVLDDQAAEKTGTWTSGEGLKGFVGYGYLYASPSSGATCTWTLEAPANGEFEIRIAYQPHENRGSRVPVTVTTPAGSQTTFVNMQQPAAREHGFQPVGTYRLRKTDAVQVTISAADAGGFAHADAVQLMAIE